MRTHKAISSIPTKITKRTIVGDLIRVLVLQDPDANTNIDVMNAASANKDYTLWYSCGAHICRNRKSAGTSNNNQHASANKNKEGQ